MLALQQNTAGLALDTRVSGHVAFQVTPPLGAPIPLSLRAGVEFVNGRGQISLTFTDAGYYRIEARGPGDSLGWVTVDVGVNANTP